MPAAPHLRGGGFDTTLSQRSSIPHSIHIAPRVTGRSSRGKVVYTPWQEAGAAGVLAQWAEPAGLGATSPSALGPTVYATQHGRCWSRARPKQHIRSGLPKPFRAAAGSNQGTEAQLDVWDTQLLFADLNQSFTQEDLCSILPALSPKQLADAIWSFCNKQAVQPTTDVMDAVASEVQSKLTLFRSQDLSNTIWALAVLKYLPSAQWWSAFESQVYSKLTDFTDRELANLMWALAVLEHRPEWVMEPLLSHAVDNFSRYSANSLHLIIWGLGKLGYCPSEEWLQGFLRAAQGILFQFTPSEMSNIIWALAKLGRKPPSMWLDNFLMAAQWRFPSFSAKLLSIVAWSAAMLDHTPSREWLLCYEQQVREKFGDFSGQELACVAWALRKFGYTSENNAVFYMLDRQDRFLSVDFEILGNSKLLGQVLTWKADGSSSSSSSQDGRRRWDSGGIGGEHGDSR